MPLVTTQQFGGLQPDITGAIAGGLINRQRIQEQANLEKLRQQAESQLGTRQRALGVSATPAVDETQEQALQRTIADDPVKANQMLATLGIVDQTQKEKAAAFASEVLNAPEDQKKSLINKRIREIAARGGDPGESLLLLDLPPEQLTSAMQGLEAAALTSLQRKKITASIAKTAAAKTGTPSIVDLGVDAEGNALSLSRDPSSGTVKVITTPTTMMTAQEKADLAVTTEERKETVKLAAKEEQKITSEIRESARLAARSKPKLSKALKLANLATQGFTGSVKLAMSRFFNNDVSDEAALDSAFLGLALDELQKFKGPTTDFEFGKAQAVAGSLGDSKMANISRIKSLMRNRWFVSREAEQFKQHIRAKGKAIDFEFNFNEMIRTKAGLISLRDIQDTAVANNMTIDEAIKEFNN